MLAEQEHCGKHTQPGQLGAELGLFGVDPEPDGAGGVPGVDVCALWYFGKVRLEGTWVVSVRVDADLYIRASSNSGGRCSCLELVAADVVALHVADESIVLPVLGLTDTSPGCGTVDAWESVLRGQLACPEGERCNGTYSERWRQTQ